MTDMLYKTRNIIPSAKSAFVVPVQSAALAPPAGAIAWYSAYSNANLTVNTDGTGGPPADGASIGRINDISGNGNHLLPIAASTRAIYRAGYGINCIWDPDGTIVQSALINSSFTSTPSQNCSGGFAMDLPGWNGTCVIDLGVTTIAIYGGGAGAPGSMTFYLFNNHQYANVRPIGRKCVMTWRSNASNFVIGVNGLQQSLATTVSSATMTQINLATFAGGNPKPVRYYEGLIYNTDIGSTGQTQLENYLIGNIGTYDSTRTVATFGDSLSYGVGSNILKSVFDTSYISNRLNSLWYLFNADGGILLAPHVTAAELVSLKGTNEGVVIVWMGTNDIVSAGQTGAATETRLNTYCTTLQAGGCKVIVSTLQAFVPNNAERLAFNTAVRANFAGYANALVDLAAATELSDSTNTTYYETDGIHLTDAGYAVAAALYQTALASI